MYRVTLRCLQSHDKPKGVTVEDCFDRSQGEKPCASFLSPICILVLRGQDTGPLSGNKRSNYASSVMWSTLSTCLDSGLKYIICVARLRWCERHGGQSMMSCMRIIVCRRWRHGFDCTRLWLSLCMAVTCLEVDSQAIVAEAS